MREPGCVDAGTHAGSAVGSAGGHSEDMCLIRASVVKVDVAGLTLTLCLCLT